MATVRIPPVLRPKTGGTPEVAHAVALQVASMKAKYLTRDDVPADDVANERRIAEETAKEEGKPEQALPKIVEGRLTGFFKDVVLLEQQAIADVFYEAKLIPRRIDATDVKIFPIPTGRG